MPLSGTLGSSHTRRVRRSPSYSAAYPGPSNPGNRADWTRWQVESGLLEFAFPGELRGGTILARLPSKDGKK